MERFLLIQNPKAIKENIGKSEYIKVKTSTWQITHIQTPMQSQKIEKPTHYEQTFASHV